jgi:hypothetical protein
VETARHLGVHPSWEPAHYFVGVKTPYYLFKLINTVPLPPVLTQLWSVKRTQPEFAMRIETFV